MVGVEVDAAVGIAWAVVEGNEEQRRGRGSRIGIAAEVEQLEA